jgi:hypothetical protein
MRQLLIFVKSCRLRICHGGALFAEISTRPQFATQSMMVAGWSAAWELSFSGADGKMRALWFNIGSQLRKQVGRCFRVARNPGPNRVVIR